LFRYIYEKIIKYNKSVITYVAAKKMYYIHTKNGKKELLRNDFIDDIIIYMNYVCEHQSFIYLFLIKIMKEFMEIDYPKMIETCNKCEDKSCSICLENCTEANNINLCFFCKNIFHQSCITQVWKSGHDHCPLCRRDINSSFYTYLELRYELIRDILLRIDL
jgi:hypothetical protein